MLFKEKKCSDCDTYYDPTLEKCPSCHKDNELYLNRTINNHITFMYPLAQIGLFLIGFRFVGMYLAQALFGSLFSFIKDKTLYQTLTITFSYLLMLSGLLSVIFLTRKKHFLSKFNHPLDYIYGLGYAFTLLFVGAIITSIVALFYKMDDNTNQEAAISIVSNYPIIAFIIMGLLGPICEELTYRVGLYSLLRRINKYLALIVSAVIFAIIHFSFSSENMINELWALPQYIGAGIILGLAYEHHGPACSLTAHLLYNIFVFFTMVIRIYGK